MPHVGLGLDQETDLSAPTSPCKSLGESKVSNYREVKCVSTGRGVVFGDVWCVSVVLAPRWNGMAV